MVLKMLFLHMTIAVIGVDNLWDSFANLHHDVPMPPSTTG